MLYCYKICPSSGYVCINYPSRLAHNLNLRIQKLRIVILNYEHEDADDL